MEASDRKIEVLGVKTDCPVVISCYGSFKSLLRDFGFDEDIDPFLNEKISEYADKILSLINVKDYRSRIVMAERIIKDLKTYLKRGKK